MMSIDDDPSVKNALIKTHPWPILYSNLLSSTWLLRSICKSASLAHQRFIFKQIG
jgi:hypothetical protein